MVTLLNRLHSEVKDLDSLMFCLTSQKQINKVIARRDLLETRIGFLRRLESKVNDRNYIASTDISINPRHYSRA